ncbi:MAG: hypothetical protein WCK67_05955 [bacterium]
MIKKRNYNNRFSNSVDIKDRIFSIITYLTMGTFGFIWLIISHVRGTNISNYLRFNITQSIFISVALYLLNIILSFLVGLIEFIIKIIDIIPFIGNFIAGFLNIIMSFTLNFGIFNYSIFELLFIVLNFYFIFMSVVGKYPELPYVSDKIVRRMI